MLTFDETTFGIQKCALDLSALYPTIEERRAFDTRFDDFMKSDPYNQQIFHLRGNILKYDSEVFVSDKIDDRPPLLLLLGNPASHSVAAGMCFAFEGDHQEHRFWKGLSDAGILTFSEPLSNSASPDTMNEMRQNALLELRYTSPFRVGIAVFYSLPSTASDPRWSGVNGVRKLLGVKAFETISPLEELKISKLISIFMGVKGGIIAFQKDAYDRVRSQDTPAYSLDFAKQGLLLGKYKNGKNILLAASPPTRLMYSDNCKSALLKYKTWLCQQLSIADDSLYQTPAEI
jgi:hypothetical protein